MRRMLAGLCLALAASGCSSTGEGQRLARDVAAWLVPGLQNTAAPTSRYTALAQAGAPVRRLTQEASGQRIALRRAGPLADGTVLWLAPDEAGYTFREGILVATRGAGNDLMAAEVDQLLALIHSGQGGTAERFHAYLDGTGGIVLRSYVCTVTQGVGQILEDCAGLEDNFINAYRIASGGGGVLTSRQHPGPDAGAVLFEDGAR